MGKEKGGFLTPKAIANRIKAKGLQKLRWYCQMCQKQCRDENGFKCHMMSESHQRQLLLFAENPDEYIDTFSKDFEEGYVELLRRRFGTKRVHCNIVYQEYISLRDHVHMNSTQWETLTDFIKYLGREGIAEVDNTEKGWFVKYIDRDPEAIKRQQAKEKMDMDDNERTAKFIEEQVERAAKAARNVTQTEYTELQRESEEEKVAFSLGGMAKKEDKNKSGPGDNALSIPSSSQNDGESERGGSKSKIERDAGKSSKGSKAGEKRKSALDEIMQFEEQKKEKMNRKEYWLHTGIVVKIITKKLGEKFYKKKGVVKEVIDLYGGVVKMIDTGTKVKVDQSHVETVVPAQGKPVVIVNGAYRGQTAVLEDINEKKFCCTVSLNSGPLKGRVLEKIPYEDISKQYQPS